MPHSHASEVVALSLLSLLQDGEWQSPLSRGEADECTGGDMNTINTYQHKSPFMDVMVRAGVMCFG
jgi:hypothetical protein